MLLHLNLCALVLALSPLASIAATPSYDYSSQTILSQVPLSDILLRGFPILGPDNGCSKTLKTCDWMAKIPDNTPLVQMNLPGTHDTSSCPSLPSLPSSYTANLVYLPTRELLRHNRLRPVPGLPPGDLFRCQEHPLLQSLNDGIRVFDFHLVYDSSSDTIGFYHSLELLVAPTAMTDVFFGLYQWLNKHPTEAVLLLINQQDGDFTAKFQEKVYDIINSDAAKKYWVQTSGNLGTLGQARGKITLLQRFTFDLLPAHKTKQIGIQLMPSPFTDRRKAFEVVYNADKGLTAFIQKYCACTLPLPLTPSQYIEDKFGATTAHLSNATLLNPDQLYISFASANVIIVEWLRLDMTPRCSTFMMPFRGSWRLLLAFDRRKVLTYIYRCVRYGGWLWNDFHRVLEQVLFLYIDRKGEGIEELCRISESSQKYSLGRHCQRDS